MKNPKPRDEKLAGKIVEEFHAAGQRGDLAAFKRLLGKVWGTFTNRSEKSVDCGIQETR